MFNFGKKKTTPSPQELLPTPEKTSVQQARENIEKLDMKPGVKDKLKQNQIDLLRKFVQVFNSTNGEEVLNHLDLYSHKNFPNYENVNATYSKIGEQTLVAYIKSMLYKAKKGGE